MPEAKAVLTKTIPEARAKVKTKVKADVKGKVKVEADTKAKAAHTAAKEEVALKRPAASVEPMVEADTEAKATHTAAKEAEVMLKRPAASVETMAEFDPAKVYRDDVYEKLRTDFPRMKRNAFTCRAYDTGKRRAKAAGANPHTGTAFAKVHLRTAAELFDELCS